MSEAAAHTLPSGTRIGEYEVTGLLGAGGMGTVYAGVHPVIGKRVAIKVLAPVLSSNERMVSRFVQEARAVVKIQHRHIIDVFAFGHAPDVGHYFVMPMLEGESLRERIARGGPMTMSEAQPVLRQIASALDTAHAAGIYHRDLKPDNVFLVRDSSGATDVRVLDFGIAKLLDSDVTATQTGVQMGTPLFMSPEQWDGEGVDHRTDIYALGVLVHHLVTGRYPFESKSPVALMNLHANHPPMAPSQYGADPALDPVVAQALAKDKTRRFDSAGAFVRALEDATSASPAPPTPIPAAISTAAPTQTGTRPARGRLAALVAVIAVGGIGVAIGVMNRDAAAPSAAPSSDAAVPDAVPAAGLAVDAGQANYALADAAPTQAPARPPAKPPAEPRIRRPTRPPPDDSTVPKPAPRIDAGATKPPEPKKPPVKPVDGDKTQWGDTAKPF